MKNVRSEVSYKCKSNHHDTLNVSLYDGDGYECVAFITRDIHGVRQAIVHVDPYDINKMIDQLHKIKQYINDNI